MDNFKLKSNLFFGKDSLCALDDIDDANVIIVCDEFIRKSGMVEKITEHLERCTVHIFDRVVPDADTGMDALTHAIESYLSTKSNDFTDALAEKSVTLLMRFLPYAYAHGDDMEAREKVHNAACLAGMSFNMVGLGINHSIAHAIGAKFHIPHGRANALLLPHVIEFNAFLESGTETVAARKMQRLSKLIGLPYSSVPLAVSSLCSKIRDMNRLFGIPDTLAKMDICTENVNAIRREMAETAMADVCTQTNPRKPNADGHRGHYQTGHRSVEKKLLIAIWQ